MTNTATNVKQQTDARTAFTVVERQISNAHKVQFYMDYGATDGGPWLRIGINSTEFGVGFLPNPTTELRVASETR